jgi:AcrR family transcriptional regulator
LSAESVVAAGVSLVRREGLDAVGVRAVAGELGVTPMALYRYVADGSALRAAVVASILEGLPDVPADGAAGERLRRWAHGARAALAAHPGTARHLLLHWTEEPRALDVVEQLLATCTGAGAADAVAAANAVFTYTLMRVEAEQAVRAGGVRRRLARLEEHPLLRANAGEYAVARVDEHFAFGLDALLAGIDRARRRGRGRRGAA